MTVQLNSSCLHSATVENEDLFITFHSGDVYKYPGKAGHFEALTTAESAGQYFNSELYCEDCVQVGQGLVGGLAPPLSDPSQALKFRQHFETFQKVTFLL